MSWNEAEIRAGHRRIFEAAQAMRMGSLSYLEGAREIVSAWRTSKLDEGDTDFLPFLGIVSETEALPFGKMRAHWSAAALEALQPDIDRSEAWAKEFGEPLCENLVRRFSNSATKIDR